MQRVIITILMCLATIISFGQKLDVYGRKMVKSVKVTSSFERSSFVYGYDLDGNVTSISADINLLKRDYRLKTILMLDDVELHQTDEIDECPTKRSFVMKNGRIISKCFDTGSKRNVYDYEYNDDGRLNSIWENSRHINSEKTFDYEIGVWRHMFKYAEGNFEGYSDQYYEYYIVPLPETMVRNVKDFYMLPKGSTQRHNRCIVFSGNENDTNLCIESFLGAFPCYYMNGVEFTCDWMGMRSDFLPDYIPTTTMTQVGNKFVCINKGIIYNYDANDNMTGFSVSYDRDNCDCKAYETLYQVEIEYVK